MMIILGRKFNRVGKGGYDNDRLMNEMIFVERFGNFIFIVICVFNI